MDGTKYPIAYAAVNKDDFIRKNSSSGGVFFLMAKEILQDGGVVFGAKINSQNEVEHSVCEKLEDISPFLGSKYVQSKMGDVYKTVYGYLKKGKKVLFSGTPCQVAGLKSFLGKEHETLYTLDLACHGVPSKLVWRSYLKESFGEKQITKINFRDKTKGWENYSLSIEFENGEKYRKRRKKDLYMKGFLQDIYLRPSCYNCQFKGICRQSDITLADFWKSESTYPELDDDKGTSLVLVHSSKGEQLWTRIVGELNAYPANIEVAVQNNWAIVRSVEMPEKRKVFYQEVSQGKSIRHTIAQLTRRTIIQKVKGRFNIFLK